MRTVGRRPQRRRTRTVWANRGSGRRTGADFQALLPADVTGLRADSKAQAEQVRSVSIERIGPVLGRLPATLMADVDAALRLHLDL